MSSNTPVDRICVWTNMPNHYQSSLFRAIRKRGIDLSVCYFGIIDDSRVSMGWALKQDLPDGELYCGEGLSVLQRIPDWQNCIHIVTSVQDAMKRGLLKCLCDGNIPWAFWSERARPGLGWYLRYPFRHYFAGKLNRFGLGTFAIGQWAMGDFIRWGVDRDRISMMPYVCDPLDTEAAPDREIVSFSRNRPTFLYCGALSKRKATDILIDAFSKISPADSNACLVLVGPDASEGSYRKQCMKHGLDDHVLFRGAVKPESLAECMICADVFLLPSRYDGWGVVLNEAASLGKPLIASDKCGGAFHLICPGENGFRVKAGDATQLADTMKQYIESPDLIETHGARSKEIFTEFHPENIAHALEKILSRWMQNRSGEMRRSNNESD